MEQKEIMEESVSLLLKSLDQLRYLNEEFETRRSTMLVIDSITTFLDKPEVKPVSLKAIGR